MLIALLLVFRFSAYALPNNEEEAMAKAKTERYVQHVYNQINFKRVNKLRYAAFSKAFYGYLNLKEANRATSKSLLAICDFSLSSNTKRLWVIDVNKKKVLFNTLVAHGMGSGEEFATRFSNTPDSHTSSLGFYITAETYSGDNGYSLRLDGIDGAWNNKARERDIVIHGADYVSADFASANNRLGRSHGCPALPRAVSDEVINKIANGSILFIYHTTKAYHKSSYWLNNTVMHLPQEADILDLLAPKDALAKAEEADSMLTQKNNLAINTTGTLVKDTLVKKVILPAATNPNASQKSTPPPVVREKEYLYVK